MTHLLNVSKRTFTIAGKKLDPNAIMEVSKIVADRHVKMYPSELQIIEQEKVASSDLKQPDFEKAFKSKKGRKKKDA